MLSDLRLIYWDSCVPLAYINGEVARLAHIEGLLQQSGKDFQIVTSVYTKTEVAFAKCEQDKKELNKETEEKINLLWLPGSPIQLVEFYELIATKAANLIRLAISNGWQLKPGDAIHLATADQLKVSEFQTYDGALDKFVTITDSHFAICRPIADQPIMVIPPHEEEPLSEGNRIEDKHEKAATAENSAPLQGSDIGHSESQTGNQEASSQKEIGEKKMTDVIELFGNCEAEKCKRPERGITDEADKITIGTKNYHRGCEPTDEELKARNRSSV